MTPDGDAWAARAAQKTLASQLGFVRANEESHKSASGVDQTRSHVMNRAIFIAMTLSAPMPFFTITLEGDKIPAWWPLYPIAYALLVIVYIVLQRQHPIGPNLERAIVLFASHGWLTWAIHQVSRLEPVDPDWGSVQWVWLGVAAFAAFLHIVFSRRTALIVSLLQWAAMVATIAVVIDVGEFVSRQHDVLQWLRVATYQGLLLVAIHTMATLKDLAHAAVDEATLMRDMAHRDSLTLLPNRRAITTQLENYADHLSEENLSVIAFDLDHFKNINDQHGHGVGDNVLRAVATATTECLPLGCTVGRWGGEEFLVVAPGVDLDRAETIAVELRQAIATSMTEEGFALTASFGVTQREPGQTVAALLEVADDAMYRAKTTGRDRIVVHSPTILTVADTAQRSPSVTSTDDERQHN